MAPSAAPLLVCAGIALLAGLWGIDRGSMWQDEATTFAVASRPLPDLWRTLGNVDAVHGVHYLLLHPLLSLADGVVPAEVVIRVPSALATAVAAAGVAALGRRLVSAPAGVYAGAVYALSPVVSYYAQEGRSYALVTAAAVLATHLLVRALDEPRRTGRWVWYAVAVAAGCLLNLFAALALLAHAVTLLAGRARPGVMARWTAACAAGLLPVAPVAWVSFGQRGQISWLEPPGWATAGELVTRFAGTGVPLALAAVLAVAALTLRRPEGAPVSLAAVAVPLTILPPAVLLTVSQIEPFYQDRYVLYAVAGQALLTGAGITAAVRRIPAGMWRGLASCGLLALLVVPTLPAHAEVRRAGSRPDDPAAAARLVGAGARPGDAVLFLPSIRRLVAEAYPQSFRQVRDVALRVSGAASGTLAGRELPDERIAAALGPAPRVWVISRSHPRDSDLSSPRDTVKRTLLRDGYNRAWVARVPGYAVRLYVRKGTAQSQPRSSAISAASARVPAPVLPMAADR